MEKGFKQLAGMRVMLSLPKREDFGIKLAPDVQREVDKEFASKLISLEIYAVGDSVEKYKEGMKVYVPSQDLSRGNFIDVNGEQKVIINSMDISLEW